MLELAFRAAPDTPLAQEVPLGIEDLHAVVPPIDHVDSARSIHSYTIRTEELPLASAPAAPLAGEAPCLSKTWTRLLTVSAT